MREFSYFLLKMGFEGVDSLCLGSEVERLQMLAEFIRDQGESISRTPEVYSAEIVGKKPLYEILWCDNDHLGRDQRSALQNILDRSAETEMSDADVLAKVNERHPDEVCGLIFLNRCLNPVPIATVNTQDEWLKQHRYSYAENPGSEEVFSKACIKYFDNICFHDKYSSTLATLEPNLASFSKSLIRCLSFLNDEFCQYFDVNNVDVSYAKCSAALNIEMSAEGNLDRKEDLTFNFNGVQVYCEPHLKLSKSDNKGDGHFYYNRVYFHPGNPDVCSGKLLVAHTGKHL